MCTVLPGQFLGLHLPRVLLKVALPQHILPKNNNIMFNIQRDKQTLTQVDENLIEVDITLRKVCTKCSPVTQGQLAATLQSD